MAKKTKVTVNGIGFWSLLGIVFLVLKLTGVIGWAWWVVLLPFYGPLALAVVLVFLFALFGVSLLDD